MPVAHDQPDNSYRTARLGVARVITRNAYNADVVAPVMGQMLSDRRVAAVTPNWRES